VGEPGLVGPDGRPSDASESASRRRRRRSPSQVSTRTVRRRLRALYFSLAALWGFLAGTAAVLIGLTTAGRSPGLAPRSVMIVAGAAVLSLVGGLVVAAAYRSATRRYR
jgi:hypothetical protein